MKQRTQTLNRIYILLGLLIFVAFPAIAQQQVVYLEGDPELRRGSRSLMMDFGDELQSGDSIHTGINDLVELSQGTGNSITVLPDSIFSVQDTNEGGVTARRLTTSRGGARFVFDQPGGSRRIGTATTAAGVRGTVFTVLAAADGSAMYSVERGMVEVESQGQMVQVAANQAVEVAPNSPPGQVVEFLGRELDFSGYLDWNTKCVEMFLENPESRLNDLTQELIGFARDMEGTYMEFQDSRGQLQAARARMADLQNENQEEFDAYRQDIVFPLMSNTGNLYLNYRYFALSALSLRINAAGSLYVQAKARLLLEPENQLWLDYMDQHAFFVQQFRARIVPLLQDGDI